MAATSVTTAQKRVLKGLLDVDPKSESVRNLATSPDRWNYAWRVVQALEAKGLVKLGAAEGALAGTDYSTVPVRLTPTGRALARSL